MALALSGARVFDGEQFHDGKAVLITGNTISAVVAMADIPHGTDIVHLKGGTLAPGFIDVQVNGGGGALLNDNPSIGVVRQIAESHRRHGTTGLLPTVITDAPNVVTAAIAAVRDARAAGIPGILGIHVEGPFLDPARKGAHDLRFIRKPLPADLSELTRADCGVAMLTLAPNMATPANIAALTGEGIRVSLGHAEATMTQVEQALAAGATGFTHLFNAMSQITTREPGMVGAALADDASFMGIIVDGHHVHPANLRIAIAAAGTERFMLVSDAMPPAAGGTDSFSLQGRSVRRVGDRLELPDGTLAGSNLTMDMAVKNCIDLLELPLASALQMASRNPARFLGLHKSLGHIAPGALASLVHLDDTLTVTQTWINGT